MTLIYNCATTVNGFIADEKDSLQWLFEVPGSDAAAEDINTFLKDIDGIVMGSTTYEWLLNALDNPEDLTTSYGDRPIWVFSSRELPLHAGTNVKILNSSVEKALPELNATASNIWVMGGGDLAGQFFDAGALDRIILTVAPVFLASGRPTLPRRIESDQLSLENVRQMGQFIEMSFLVGEPL